MVPEIRLCGGRVPRSPRERPAEKTKRREEGEEKTTRLLVVLVARSRSFEKEAVAGAADGEEE